MAKINIKFNNTDYSIDESRLSDILATLKSHFSTTMSGSGATINFDGVDYSIDSTKLTAAKNVLVERLGAISGSDSKVVIDGVEYGIGSAKVGDAIADLHTAFEELEAGGEEADALQGTWVFNKNIYSKGYVNSGDEFDVNFTVVGVTGYTFARLIFRHIYSNGRIKYLAAFSNESQSTADIYTSDSNSDNASYWLLPSPVTFIITSKLDEVENGDRLLSWLQANATKQ